MHDVHTNGSNSKTTGKCPDQVNVMQESTAKDWLPDGTLVGTAYTPPKNDNQASIVIPTANIPAMSVIK